MKNFDAGRRSILAMGMTLPFTGSSERVYTVDNKDPKDIQRKIDYASKSGGTVILPPGLFYIDSPIEMRSGVSLVGSGRHYTYGHAGNIFTGSWIIYRGPIGQPAIRLRSIQHCSVRNLGVNCEEKSKTTAIEIGSNNNPACKSIVIENISLFGSAVAVQWGLANTLSKNEQCDDISFRDIGIYSCENGFLVNAANSSDYSLISRVTMSNLKSVGFDLVGPGFLKIENCAIGAVNRNTIAFKVSGNSPDPLTISNCQIEPTGLFLFAEGPNDEGTIILEKNVVNSPIIASGILRIVSQNNYVNSSVTLSGFVRWRSRDDVWAGMHGRPVHDPQVFTKQGSQFIASSMLNASHYLGSYLPKGFIIETANSPIMGKVVVRAGIVCQDFVKGAEYSVGSYVKPKNDNGVAYLVVKGGSFMGEPMWGNTKLRLGNLELNPIGPTVNFQDFGLLPT